MIYCSQFYQNESKLYLCRMKIIFIKDGIGNFVVQTKNTQNSNKIT